MLWVRLWKVENVILRTSADLNYRRRRQIIQEPLVPSMSSPNKYYYYYLSMSSTIFGNSRRSTCYIGIYYGNNEFVVYCELELISGGAHCHAMIYVKNTMWYFRVKRLDVIKGKITTKKRRTLQSFCDGVWMLRCRRGVINVPNDVLFSHNRVQCPRDDTALCFVWFRN